MSGSFAEKLVIALVVAAFLSATLVGMLAGKRPAQPCKCGLACPCRDECDAKGGFR
jgi:hypothetical protein